MKRAAIVFVLLLAYRPDLLAQPPLRRPAGVREVVVAVRDARVAKKTLDSAGRVISRMPDSRMLLIRLHRRLPMAEALAKLSMETEVLFAAPNVTSTATATPNDPLFGQQCGLVVTETDKAWELWEPVVVTNVAILDTGVSHQHDDLTLKMKRKSSGVIDGYNAFNHNSGAQGDSNGHGTACAGIAAAQTNNGTMVAGVAGWNGDTAASDTTFTRIMPVRTHNANKRGTVWSCAGGIGWAAGHGAQVINMSWVLDNEIDTGLGFSIPGSYNAPVVDAVYEAWRKDVVLIASAGNDGSNTPRAPANMRPVFAVGATDCNDALRSDSNYGNWVNVVAPGNNHTTYPHQGHDNFAGTSAAAPIVTGAAALIRSQNPNLNEAYVRHIIENNADEYTGRRIQDGGGRINVRRALAAAGKPTLNLTLSPDTTEGGVPPVTGTVTLAQPATSFTLISLSTLGDAVQVPPTLTIPPGFSSATFPVEVVSAPDLPKVTIVARGGGGVAAKTLWVDELLHSVKDLLVDQSLIRQLRYIVMELAFGEIPRTDVAITLTSSVPGVLQLPRTILMAAGHQRRTLLFRVGAVTQPTAVTIRAAVGRSVRETTITIPK